MTIFLKTGYECFMFLLLIPYYIAIYLTLFSPFFNDNARCFKKIGIVQAACINQYLKTKLLRLSCFIAISEHNF